MNGSESMPNREVVKEPSLTLASSHPHKPSQNVPSSMGRGINFEAGSGGGNAEGGDDKPWSRSMEVRYAKIV